MQYILDTSFFVITRRYYPSTFPAFWTKMEEAVNEHLISSVNEVKNEIENYGGEQSYLLEWINKHKGIFTDPIEEEQRIIIGIFKIEKFQTLLDKKTFKRRNTCRPLFNCKSYDNPRQHRSIRERHATRDERGNVQGALKIPDVRQHFKIKVVSPEGFLKEVRWQF